MNAKFINESINKGEKKPRKWHKQIGNFFWAEMDISKAVWQDVCCLTFTLKRMHIYEEFLNFIGKLLLHEKKNENKSENEMETTVIATTTTKKTSNTKRL